MFTRGVGAQVQQPLTYSRLFRHQNERNKRFLSFGLLLISLQFGFSLPACFNRVGDDTQTDKSKINNIKRAKNGTQNSFLFSHFIYNRSKWHVEHAVLVGSKEGEKGLLGFCMWACLLAKFLLKHWTHFNVIIYNWFPFGIGLIEDDCHSQLTLKQHHNDYKSFFFLTDVELKSNVVVAESCSQHILWALIARVAFSSSSRNCFCSGWSKMAPVCVVSSWNGLLSKTNRGGDVLGFNVVGFWKLKGFLLKYFWRRQVWLMQLWTERFLLQSEPSPRRSGLRGL